MSYEEKFKELMRVIVALNRSMDQHATMPDRLMLLKSDWEFAVKRALFLRESE
jgi:hypothetical protein